MADLRLLAPGFSELASALVAIARDAGLSPTVTSTYRSTTEQARLYRRWKAGLSRFPANPPGRSLHEKGLAFDMDLPNESMLQPLGELWESLGPGFRWGGNFSPRPDPIHFEFRP